MVVSVSESGASVYSASETARKEFPSLDITVRGAISIGRRLESDKRPAYSAAQTDFKDYDTEENENG